MKTPILPTFHETLCQTICAVENHLREREIVPVANADWQSKYDFDGIPYGTNKESHFEIESIKGKKTSKWGHVTIWRSNSGRYEVNFYVL